MSYLSIYKGSALYSYFMAKTKWKMSESPGNSDIFSLVISLLRWRAWEGVQGHARGDGAGLDRGVRWPCRFFPHSSQPVCLLLSPHLPLTSSSCWPLVQNTPGVWPHPAPWVSPLDGCWGFLTGLPLPSSSLWCLLSTQQVSWSF